VEEGKARGENDDNDQEKLSFKVARLSGFSIFCDWQDVDKPENGGIDLQRLIDEDKARDEGQKSRTARSSGSYYEAILQNEFNSDGKL